MANHELMALTPVDGRYAGRVSELSEIVSEYGLIKYRVNVESEWLRTLAGGTLPDVVPLSAENALIVESLHTNFSVEDAQRIKEIEKTTNHDVKAVEMWMRERLGEAGGFEDYLELIHFGCTSEDINNLAYAMMLRDARDKVILPAFDKIGQDLETKAHDYADIPMLAKTHGQPATPTTLGKEMAVFVERLSTVVQEIAGVAIRGKFNGASGTYGADVFAYPELNWTALSDDFVRGLGFVPSNATTQIEPHDYMARYFNELALANTIMTDLARDMWAYISNGVFKQGVTKGEVGSSTMPHKVNPIDFENAEANFGLANALAVHLSGKLPISRLQRDLTDSSSQRSIGEVLGHTLVAQKSLLKGLGKVSPNQEAITLDLNGEWSILAEPLQTIMRKHKVSGAYDIIKEASRGQAFTEETYKNIVNGLDIPEDDKERLLALTPDTYIGLASQIAKNTKYRE